MLLRPFMIRKRSNKRSTSQRDRVGENQRIQNEVRAQSAEPMRQPTSRRRRALLFHFYEAGAVVHLDIVKKLLRVRVNESFRDAPMPLRPDIQNQ